MSPGIVAPPSRSRLAVLGAGAWGTVLAALLGAAGHDVRLWVRDHERAARWARERRDPAGRSQLAIPDGVRPLSDLDEALGDADALFAVVPNAGLDALLTALREVPSRPAAMVSCSKGLFAPDLARPSARIAAVLPDARTAVLSGPNLAGEIAAGLPAAATVASRDRALAEQVQAWLGSERFRVYTDDDPVGVEVAGAYKNVIALAAGMADALGLGENAKAALITRGLAETVRIGRHLGGRSRTFSGLSGLGDLVATCASGASRNHSAGERLARGERAEALLAEGLTAEGLATVRAVVGYADRHGLRLPIARQVHAVAFDARPADAALQALLAGDPRAEWEGVRG